MTTQAEALAELEKRVEALEQSALTGDPSEYYRRSLTGKVEDKPKEPAKK